MEDDDMEDDGENRIAPIAALVAMFLVSVTIVGLTFWSGDLFGPWTSVPPAAAAAAVEARRVETLPPMLRASGADESVEAVRTDGHAEGGARRAAGGAAGADR